MANESKNLTELKPITVPNATDLLYLGIPSGATAYDKDGAIEYSAFASAFAPTVHTHVWADITDKPTLTNTVNGQSGTVVLDYASVGAAPTVHTHVWADITDKPTLTNTVNGLSGTVVLDYASVGAAPTVHTHVWADITDKPTLTNTVNGLSGTVVLDYTSVGAAPTSHTHTMSQITDSAAQLALKANLTGATFSGNLNITNTSPSLRLNNSALAASFLQIHKFSDSIASVNNITEGGESIFNFNPLPSDGTSAATVAFLRNTNTTGTTSADFYRGNGNNHLNCRIGGNTNSAFNILVGNFGVGIATPETKVDFNSDSIRIRNRRSPASNASGFAGEICYDATYIYVCLASGSWRRIPWNTY